MMNRITDVVKHLLIINVIMFVCFHLTPLSKFNDLLTLYFPLSQDFKPYQIVSHMFMHGSPSHLLFNMMSLFFLGPMVETNLGSKRFLLFYLVCGFAAFILHIGIGYFNYAQLTASLDPESINTVINEGRNLINSGRNWNGEMGELNSVINIGMVGASGAIMGIFIAFALLYPNVKLMLIFPPIPVKAKYLMIVLVLVDLFSGVSGFRTGIAHFAHLGGAIMGFILISIWGKNYLLRP